MQTNIQLLPSPSGLVFFEPNERFFEYLATVCPNRQVVDVGAGRGFLSASLFENGYQVLAIDLFIRENMLWPVHVFDATLLEYPKNTLPIIARPRHNDWIDQVVERALETVELVLYVGLEMNYAEDLSELAQRGFRLTYLQDEVGMEGERVVEIRRPRTDQPLPKSQT